MDYERKYKEALERAMKLKENPQSVFNEYSPKEGDTICDYIFPELKESEDKKIVDAIRKALESKIEDLGNGVTKTACIAWLEKQGEKPKPSIRERYKRIANSEWFKKTHEGMSVSDDEKVDNVNKVEPKFHEGDWAVSNLDGKARQISEVHFDEYNSYYVVDGKSVNLEEYDRLHHLWTIQDAKDGDVLSYVTDEEDLWIMIYWSLYEPYEGHVHYHALLVNDNFSDKGTCCICINDLKPATKEQHDIFFQKMKEAGYQWDSEKKESVKIKNYDDKLREAICE